MATLRLKSWNCTDAIEAYPDARKCNKAKELHRKEALAEKYEKRILSYYKSRNYSQAHKIWNRVKRLKLQDLCNWDWEELLTRHKTTS